MRRAVGIARSTLFPKPFFLAYLLLDFGIAPFDNCSFS